MTDKGDLWMKMSCKGWCEDGKDSLSSTLLRQLCSSPGDHGSSDLHVLKDNIPSKGYFDLWDSPSILKKTEKLLISLSGVQNPRISFHNSRLQIKLSYVYKRTLVYSLLWHETWPRLWRGWLPYPWWQHWSQSSPALRTMWEPWHWPVTQSLGLAQLLANVYIVRWNILCQLSQSRVSGGGNQKKYIWGEGGGNNKRISL